MGFESRMSDIASIDFERTGLDEAVARAAAEVSANGAALLRGIVPQPLVARMRADLDCAAAEDTARFGNGHPFPGMVHALMLRGGSFLDLIGLDAVRAVARALLGHGAMVHAFNSSSV